MTINAINTRTQAFYTQSTPDGSKISNDAPAEAQIIPFSNASRAAPRTPEEIRLRFLYDRNGPNVTELMTKIWRALVNPNLNGNDLKVYLAGLGEGDGFAWSNDRVGKLLNMSGKTVQRSWSVLDAHGFSAPHRRQRQTTERSFPMSKITVVALEIEEQLRRTPSVRKPKQGRTDLSVQDVVCDNIDTQTLERTKTAFRTDKSVRQPQSLPQSRRSERQERNGNDLSSSRGEKSELQTQIDALSRQLAELGNRVARSGSEGVL